MADVYLTFGGGMNDPVEVGPFDSATLTNQLKINGSSNACASYANGVWTITDGAALGNSGLTSTTWPVILGQAK